MFSTRWMAAVVGLVLVQSAVATNITGQTPQPSQFNYAGYFVRGVGNTDCGKMTDELRTSRELWSSNYVNYGWGFFTGANFVSSMRKQGNNNVGADTSPEAFLAAMEQYCGQHPLEKVVDALASVYDQLAAR